MKNWHHGSLVLSLLLVTCAREYIGEDPPVDRLHFPLGVVVSPVERTALVVSSNFDLAYNRGVVHSVDLASLDDALANRSRLDEPLTDVFRGAALIPSFGGLIRMTSDGRHAFVSSRTDNTLVEIALATPEAGRILTCGRGGDLPESCDRGDHVISLIGADPFSLTLSETTQERVRIYIAARADGTVDVVDADLSVTGQGRLSRPFSIQTGLARASGIAMRAADGVAPPFLVVAGLGASPLSARAYLRTFSPAGPLDQELGTLSLFAAGQAWDARTVTLADDGMTAYVLLRGPDAVASVDLAPGDDGLPRFRLTAMRNVGRKPTTVVWDGQARDGPQLLVTCFEEDALYALDANSLAVLAVLGDIGPGPTDIALDPGTGRAYVTLFGDDSLAVVALDRDGHAGLERIATLGEPRPKPEESISLDPFSYF